MTTPLCKTWQFYKTAIRTLGMKKLTTMYCKSAKQIYRWAADPNYSEEHQRNPLDRIETMLDELCNVGREETAQRAVARMADIVGCELVGRDGQVPDKETLNLENLDDFDAVNAYTKSTQVSNNLFEVQELK